MEVLWLKSRSLDHARIAELAGLSTRIVQEWVRTELPKIRVVVQKYGAILYFQEEVNVSLTALLGKT
jgi:hypothetical protein